MKFKPKQSDVYKITSINEAHSDSGHPLSMVGAFVCADRNGTEFRVGAGKLSHEERRKLWERWQDGLIPPTAMLRIEYQTLSDAAGVPHFSRAVEVLEEGEFE